MSAFDFVLNQLLANVSIYQYCKRDSIRVFFNETK